MNDRERVNACLMFQKVDRIPLQPGGGRESTRNRWYSESLPKEIKPGDINRYAYEQEGGRFPWPEGGRGFHVDERMIPQFEGKILEELPDSRIVQDWKGNICEIGKEFTPEYLSHAIDFVTRRWIKCPVENRTDWADMKKRYLTTTPERLPADAAALGRELEERTWPTQIHFSGPYWQLREWLGFEQLCVMFYDDPDFIRDMLDFWKEYVGELLRLALKHHVPDCVHISEDMAYKGHSMLSPQMTREYLMPIWKYWGEIARSAGVPVFAIDSDGCVDELIPLWIESGVNACDPIEVAAGNDIVAFRREFGRDMAYRGGVDKRAMAAGGKVIEAEIERLRPVIEDGGFIPSCDHGVPADVSWDNYRYYIKLLAQATGW